VSAEDRSNENAARAEAQQRLLSRRAVLRAGLVAAPVLLSVSAVPAWAQTTSCPSGTVLQPGTGKGKKATPDTCVPASSQMQSDFSGSSLTDGGFNQPALTDGGLSSGGLGGN
jgi:hypothetical protein